jgi:hypothetical protein
MRHFLLLLLAGAILPSAYTQSLKKYSIGLSGCSAYFFCDPGAFSQSFSEDSSTIYTGECRPADSLSYGVICVKLKEAVKPGEEAEELMIAYLDYLKTVLNIASSAGYGKGHTMEKKPEVRGIIDYWKDKDGDEWKIKSWTDGKFIAFMYVYADGILNETERLNVFLNGFRFPGM